MCLSLLCSTSFNSKLVRLEGLTETTLHYPDESFNSKLVRLEVHL